MGNRTYLSLGKNCQFDANNCVPVTWLALFTPDEFEVLYDQEDPEEGEINIYRTSQSLALERLTKVIQQLKTSSVWGFLRPLEILKEELQTCLPTDIIELDVTQFDIMDGSSEMRAKQAVSDFRNFVNAVPSKETDDIVLFAKLVNKFELGSSTDINNLSSEDKMFLFIGGYSSSNAHEEKYSLAYFSDNYWKS